MCVLHEGTMKRQKSKFIWPAESDFTRSNLRGPRIEKISVLRKYFCNDKKRRSMLIGKWEAIQTQEAQHTEWKGGKEEWRDKAREVSLEVRSHSRIRCNQEPGLSIFMHCVWDTRILHITHAHTHCIIFLMHFAWRLHSSRQITTRFAWERK